jgi:hypothetical protein
MRPARVLQYGLTGLLSGAILATAAAQEPVREQPIRYALVSGFAGQQRALIERSAQDPIPATAGRPPVVRMYKRFGYRYRFTAETPLATLPIELSYVDGRDEQGIGLGWRLLYRIQPDSGRAIDLVVPALGFFRGESSAYVYLDIDELPVNEQQQRSGERLLIGTQAYHGQFYDFLLVDHHGSETVLPYRIRSSDGAPILFEYRSTDGGPQLHRIRRADHQILFEFDAAKPVGGLNTIRLRRVDAHQAPDVQRWRLRYEHAAPAGRQVSFLTSIGEQIGQNGPATVLRFGYRGLDEPAAKSAGESDGFCDDDNAPGGMWQEILDGRWRLPNGMSFEKKRDRGLRFTKIDRDDFIDLVSTSTDRLDAWLAGQGGGNWRHFPAYTPPRALTRANGLPPTGSQFNNLAVSFGKNDNRNTSGWQSLITSYYTAESLTRLSYHQQVYFPRVNNELGDFVVKDGSVWRAADSSPALNLPIPLQYEAPDDPQFARWPPGIPDLRPFEHAHNQGAQFVEIDGRNYLYFVGKCYIDKMTGKPLLAAHRCTGNRKFRYATFWDKREVDVYLAQAVWAAEPVWSPSRQANVREASFWKRLDLTKGEPNGQFIIPWMDQDPATEDRLFRRHLEGFRNIRFATLQRTGKTNLVIHGRAIASGFEADRCPAAKAIYRIPPRGEKIWEWVPESSGIYPPDDFFECEGAFFADIDVDGLDDLVMPCRKGDLKVYLNCRDSNNKGLWRACPGYFLPTVCRHSEKCRFVDLDGDQDVDIFVKDGARIFLNRKNTLSQFQPQRMTSFTDEHGRQRAVDELTKK